MTDEIMVSGLRTEYERLSQQGSKDAPQACFRCCSFTAPHTSIARNAQHLFAATRKLRAAQHRGILTVSSGHCHKSQNLGHFAYCTIMSFDLARYVWGLVHSQRTADMRHGLELAEQLLKLQDLDGQDHKDLIYLRAVALYRHAPHPLSSTSLNNPPCTLHARQTLGSTCCST